MFKVLPLLLCCIAVASAARVSRIRHGRPVSAAVLNSKFPFVVSVLSCGSGGCQACTGTLVAANKVLLAAHCVCGTNRMMVYFKTTQSASGAGVKATLDKQKRFICNNLQILQVQNDIALLRLEKSVTNPIVTLDCADAAVGSRVTMIGYGKDENNRSGVLRIGQRSTMTCDRRYKDAYCVDGNARSKTSTDSGDSGGPLLIQKGGGYEQIGVTHGFTTVAFKQGSKEWTETTVLWAKVGPHCAWIRS